MTEILVRPEGFVISAAATALHHISQDAAQASGLPIREALETMVRDVLAFVNGGCRVVSHHLAFDAGLIARELVRAGLWQSCDWITAIACAGL